MDIFHSFSFFTNMGKNLPAVQETQIRSLSQEDPLEKGMVTHSSILAWRIPWTEEPGRLRSIRFSRVRHEGPTDISFQQSLRFVFNSSFDEKIFFPQQLLFVFSLFFLLDSDKNPAFLYTVQYSNHVDIRNQKSGQSKLSHAISIKYILDFKDRKKCKIPYSDIGLNKIY